MRTRNSIIVSLLIIVGAGVFSLYTYYSWNSSKSLFPKTYEDVNVPTLRSIKNNPPQDEVVSMLNPDETGVIWARYQNREYGISFEFPYADELTPYLHGKGISIAYEGFKAPFESIGIGAAYPDTLKAFKDDNMMSFPGLPEDALFWKILLSINDTDFTNIQEVISYRSSSDPFPRNVVVRRMRFKGIDAALTFNSLDEWDTINPTPPVLPSKVDYSHLIFLYNKRLYDIGFNQMSDAYIDRVIRSIRVK